MNFPTQVQRQSSLQPYLDAVRSSLNAALCIRNFPSPIVECNNKPEIEVRDMDSMFVLNPIVVSRNEDQRVVIETSINSVRINFKIRQAEDLERYITHKFTSFIQKRADAFKIVRRVPVPGYDISFLITDYHVDELTRQTIVDFVIKFIQETDKELNEMKIGVIARARQVAELYLDSIKK